MHYPEETDVKSYLLDTSLQGERGRQKVTSSESGALPWSLNWTTGLGRIFLNHEIDTDHPPAHTI